MLAPVNVPCWVASTRGVSVPISHLRRAKRSRQVSSQQGAGMPLQHSGAFDSVGAELLDGRVLEQCSGRCARK